MLLSLLLSPCKSLLCIPGENTCLMWLDKYGNKGFDSWDLLAFGFQHVVCIHWVWWVYTGACLFLHPCSVEFRLWCVLFWLEKMPIELLCNCLIKKEKKKKTNSTTEKISRCVSLVLIILVEIFFTVVKPKMVQELRLLCGKSWRYST